MATQYLLLDNKTKEKFDLGTAPWYDLVVDSPFSLQSLYFDEKDLAKEMMKLSRNDKPYYESLDEALMVAKKIWQWSQGRTLYYGNDCMMRVVYDDGVEIHEIDFKFTGACYG